MCNFNFTLICNKYKLILYKIIAGSLLSKRPQDPLDAVVFVIGVQTILRQCTFSAMTRYVKYLCVYVLSCVTADRYTNFLL